MPTMIKLTCSDKKDIEVDQEYANCSMCIRKEVEKNNGDNRPIFLEKVTSAVMEKVVEWAKQHKGDVPRAEVDPNRVPRVLDDGIDNFDEAFLAGMDQATLFDLILAADYLDIKELLDTTCKYVASKIKGKQPDQVRTTFNVQNDYTAAEEDQVRKENEWCEQK